MIMMRRRAKRLDEALVLIGPKIPRWGNLPTTAEEGTFVDPDKESPYNHGNSDTR